MNRGLSAEQLGGLLDERHLATLATVRADGSIMLSPIWYIWEDGGFTLGMAAGDGKLKHIAREPRVTIVVADEAFPYRGFELRGVARMLDVPYGPRSGGSRAATSARPHPTTTTTTGAGPSCGSSPATRAAGTSPTTSPTWACCRDRDRLR